MCGREGGASRGGDKFVTLRCGGGILHAVGDISREQLTRLGEDPDRLLWENIDRPVKLGHGSQVVEGVFALHDRRTRVAFKRYRPRNMWKAFCSLFRRGRALRSWHGGQILHTNQIPTARPLAVFESRGLHRPGVSYLVTQWIDNAENLHLFGWRLAADALPDRLSVAVRCAESVGRVVGQMHRKNVSHGDLKAANILVSFEQDALETHLIDTDDVRVFRRLGRRRQVSDLARLAAGLAAHPWVSRTVCVRFFRAYASQFGPGEISWKPLWREVLQRSRHMSRKMQRHGERVL